MQLGMDQLFPLYHSVLVDLILYTCKLVVYTVNIILIVFQWTVEVIESVALTGIPH